MRHSLLVLAVMVAALQFDVSQAVKVKSKDMMRKSIVFDKNTPDVFYCPMTKPTGIDKLIVKARPLSKLCEHEGRPLPKDYKSDCYQDIDESDFACKEKYRIMMRKYPPGSEEPFDGSRLKRFLNVDSEYLEKRSPAPFTKLRPRLKTKSRLRDRLILL